MTPMSGRSLRCPVRDTFTIDNRGCCNLTEREGQVER